MRFQLKPFFLCLLLSVQSLAESKLLIWPYFPGLRFERGENQELDSPAYWSSGVGILVDNWYGSLEAGQLENSSSEGNTSVTRTYQDISLWGGYSLHEINSWRLMGQAGLGLFKERVKTRVGTLSDSDTSGERSLFGLGFEALFSESSKIWTISIGGRFYWSADLDPNPQPGIYLKLGLQL